MLHKIRNLFDVLTGRTINIDDTRKLIRLGRDEYKYWGETGSRLNIRHFMSRVGACFGGIDYAVGNNVSIGATKRTDLIEKGIARNVKCLDASDFDETLVADLVVTRRLEVTAQLPQERRESLEPRRSVAVRTLTRRQSGAATALSLIPR